jgi:cation/acetate symporter
MPFTPQHRLINPRLGSYFAIITSLFVAGVLLAMMAEQLGATDATVRAIMFACPLALFVAIGLVTATEHPADYFCAGRRIPAVFNGLVLAVAGFGGVGMISLTGAVFIMGVDAFALLFGWVVGLIFLLVLIAPYLRKFGAYTVASYLGRRFDSRTVRIVAATVFIAVGLLLLVAEIRLAAFMAAAVSGRSEQLMTAAVSLIGCLIVAGGGMRSVTWSSTAKAIVAILALLVPVTIVALLVSNLPFPQLSHGNLLRTISRKELEMGLPDVPTSALTFSMVGMGFEPLQKRFMQSFGYIGNVSFSVTTLIIAAGLAASPHLLARSGTTTSVYEARKSLGWAVLITAFVGVTAIAAAVFMRGLVVEQVVGTDGGQLPVWFQSLLQIGIASIDSKSRTVILGDIAFRRDAVIFALPIAASFPRVVTYLAMIGALAATMAAIVSGLFSVGAILSEDVINGLNRWRLPLRRRILMTRLAILCATVAAAPLALYRADPLELAIWALTLSAAASFPVLVLSVLWKRMNAAGATAGLTIGFLTTAMALLLGDVAGIPTRGPTAALFGIPAALAAIYMATRLFAAPDRHVLELVRDMRVPGGETLHDREERLARLKQQAR